MKGIFLVIFLISMLIVGILAKKQHETKIITPTGKAVKVKELPQEIKTQLDNINTKAYKRMEDAEKQE